MTNGNFTDFLTALGAFESGIDTTQAQTQSWMQYLKVFDPQFGNVDPSTVNLNNAEDLASLQYHVFNTLGFMGKYQFGEPLLIDLGYYIPAATGYYGTTATNEWQGTWTGKNGVESKADFMGAVQELAIREAFTMNMGVINSYLAQAGKTIDDYLGDQFTYTRLGEVHVATVTLSGILASAHLQGPGGVAQLFLNNIASSDEYGTNILFYMDKYSNYESPFGAAGDDHLSGSDYSETFMGGAGHNDYQTGGGDDKIVITNNSANRDVILDFDVNKDVISLSNFTGVTVQNLSISNINGHAQITFPNGQIIDVMNVAASAMSSDQFVYGPYKVTWSANSGDRILDNFNPKYDVIDLNYAFASSNLKLYEEQGSTVLDIVGNQQRVILEGISLSELSPANFIKGPVDFATMVFGMEANHTLPSGSGGTTTPPAGGGGQSGSQGGDVFSYTWNWGSHATVNQFDVAADKIDLKQFWTDFSHIDLHNDTNGNAVIDLTALNNQTITLVGVSVSALTGNNFLGLSGQLSISGNTPPPIEPANPPPVEVPPTETPPPTNGSSDGHQFSYTWNWGAHSVISNFDVSKDVINLQSFWTNYGDITIHNNSDGNAVIDLTNINNQTITLVGVSANSLLASNIHGVTGVFSQAISSGSAGSGSSGSTGTSPPPVSETMVHQMTDASLVGQNGVKDTFNFTWSWGSNKVITAFNPSEDKVDLHSFWTNWDSVHIQNNTSGNAVIDLTALNNQTITLIGVSASQLNHDNVTL